MQKEQLKTVRRISLIMRENNIKQEELMNLAKVLGEVLEDTSILQESNKAETDRLPKTTALPDEKENYLNVISDYLRRLGISANLNGYFYLRDALEMVIQDFRKIEKITKVLYPEVAKKNKTIHTKVERCIRHAIHKAFQKGDMELIESIFGYTISSEKGVPTNSEFIAVLADYILYSRG